jgi:hypothetical protein
MIFFGVLLISMFLALVAQHFVPALPPYGARVLLMPLVLWYGSLALPLPGMLALAFCGGLMWDALNVSVELSEGRVEVALGWSILLYAVLGGLMNGFRPLFQRGRWEIHCLLSGICTSFIVLAEYLMLTFRREPVVFVFNKDIWWRIGGAGIVAVLLSPFLFFALNYVAFLTGYDPHPALTARKSR